MRRCKLFFGALLTGMMSLAPLVANEANGFIAITYPQNDTLLIIDTNSKKILMYNVSESQGITLKEVRAFNKALEAPSFFYARGLSGVKEQTELDKILKATDR